MYEHNHTQGSEDGYTVHSAGSYGPHYSYHAPTYRNTIPAPPPPDGSFYACPSTPQSIRPPFAYGSQRLGAPLSYSSHPLQQWASSTSGYGGHSVDPSLVGSFERYPTNMDAYPTTVPASGDRGSTLNQLSSGDSGMTYRSEAQKGTPLDFVDSFHSELERLRQSNTSQTGSESKPVPGSAKWANRFALQTATKITVPMTNELPYAPCEFPPPEVAQHSSFMTDGWQYLERGEIKPDLGPEEPVRYLPFQNAPVQYLECGSTLPSESTAPQTALKGSAAEAFVYDGEMMAQAPPSAMVPSFTSTYGPPTVCHLDVPTLEIVYSPGTAAQWFAPTSGPPPIAITTPGPAHLLPAAASSGNVFDLTRKKGGTRKPKGRPVISCDRCHRRKRKCHSSEGSESCDFCTQMRINGDTEACTWDLMRKYSDQT